MRAPVIRDIIRRSTVNATEVARRAYIYVARNTLLPPRVRAQAQLKLNAFHSYARPTSIHNRCIYTGRSRGLIMAFRMNRILFRMWALKGKIPGVKKASW